jgi:hypothetical protein
MSRTFGEILRWFDVRKISDYDASYKAQGVIPIIVQDST